MCYMEEGFYMQISIFHKFIGSKLIKIKTYVSEQYWGEGGVLIFEIVPLLSINSLFNSLAFCVAFSIRISKRVWLQDNAWQ